MTAVRPTVASARSLDHVTGLDGLRGVAVLAVLAFHGGAGWARGGFGGVSLFFTLSGFLITSLLVREADTGDGVGLRRFWSRRFRRLLPAAVAAVALAVGLVVLAGGASAALRADALASLTYVANWRFVITGQSYAALFAEPSPLLHMWSLAVEEQLYLVLPLLVALVARRGSADNLPTRVAAVLLVAAGAATALAISGVLSTDRAYYGTDVRAAEVAVGGLLACAIARRPFAAPFASGTTRRLLAAAGPLALLALLTSWWVVERSDALVVRGGLTIHALLAATVVAAVLVPGAPLTRAMSWRPLVGLGLISYGVYLYHWPLFWWLSPERTGLDGVALAGVRLAATLAVALASYKLLEQPVRTGRWPRPSVATWLAPATVVVVAAAVVLVPVASTDGGSGALASGAAGMLADTTDVLGPVAVPVAADGSSTSTSAPAATSTTVDAGPPSTAIPAEPLRLVVVGDSTAVYLAPALNDWGTQTGAWRAAGYARLGCGITRLPERTHLGHRFPTQPECLTWEQDWSSMLDEVQPDVVVVAVGWWDAVDSVLPSGGEPVGPGDPAYDDYLFAEASAAADLLHRTGAPVLWLETAPVFPRNDDSGRYDNGASEPERLLRVDEIVRDVAATRPWLQVVPYRQLYETWPDGAADTALRPDGLHVDGTEGRGVVGTWLGPHLLAAWRTAGGDSVQ